jgi:hypothetical protein
MEDTSKDKHIHKNKHDQIQTQMQNMFVTVELLYGTWVKKEKTERSKMATGTQPQTS